MYKLHKISQRFLCRIPIDSKQGAPGPPARLCAMVYVYPYPYTHGTPCLLPTYIHALIHLFIYFYLFIYLIVFVYLIIFISLTLLFSLVLSPLALSLPLARPALGQRQQVLSLLYVLMFLFYLIIIQWYTCMVWYVCIHMYCIVYVCTSSIMYVSNRCMYVHSIVCIVLCARGSVYVQQYTHCAMQYGLPVYGMPLVYRLCVSHTCCTQCAIYSLVCSCIIKRHCVSYTIPTSNSF